MVSEPGGGYGHREHCLSNDSDVPGYQPGTATSIEVTGQSRQSKLHTVREHRPGGPTTAGPDDSDNKSGPQIQSTTPGPGAAWLGTSGGAGPGTRTDGKPAQPEAEAELGLGCGHVTHGRP